MRRLATMFRFDTFTQERPARSLLSSWRFHLTTLVLLCAALMGTVLFALITADRDELLRRVAVAHLRSALNSEVQLKAIRLDRRGTCDLSHLSVATLGSRQPLLATERIHIRLNMAQLLWKPSRPVSTIRQVIVDRPLAHVTRAKDGSWNFDSLLKKKRKPSNDHFVGEVIIRNGDVTYRDAHGWLPDGQPMQEHLVHLNARVIPASDAYMPFRVSAQSTMNHIRSFNVAGGVRLHENRVSCRINVGDVDLSTVQGFLKPSLPIHMQSGRADGRVQLLLSRDPVSQRWQPTVSIIADVKRLTGTVKLGAHQLPCTFSRGQFIFAPGAISLNQFVGEVASVPMLLDGSISSLAHPVFALQVTTANADVQQLATMIPGMARPNFAWSGTATAWAQVTGQANALTIHGHVAGPTLALALGKSTEQFTHLASDFYYGGDTVIFSNTSGRALGGAFTGNAWLDIAKDAPVSPDRTQFFVDGRVDRVNPQNLLQFLAPQGKTIANLPLEKLSGSLAGPISLRFSRDGGVAVMAVADGKVSLSDTLEGQLTTGVQVEVLPGRGVRTQVERLYLRTAAGEIQARGTLDGDQLSLQVSASKVDLAAVTKIAHVPSVEGVGYVSGEVTGSVQSPVFTGQVRAQDGRVNGRKYTDLTSQITATLAPTPQLALHDFHLFSERHQLELAASEVVARPDGKDWVRGQWHVQQITLSRTRLSSLASLANIRLDVDGFAEGIITYADYPKDARGTGRLVLSRPVVRLGKARVEFDRANIEFALHDSQTVDLTRAEIFYEGIPGQLSRLTATGRISTRRDIPSQEQLQVHIAGERIPVGNCLAVTADPTAIGKLDQDGHMQLPIELGGTISVNIDVTGQVAGPTGQRDAARLLDQSLVIHGKLMGEEDFSIARVPYRRLLSEVTFARRDNQLTLNSFELAPAKDAGYALQLTEPSTIKIAPRATIDAYLALQRQGGLSASSSAPADLAALRKDLLAMTRHTTDLLASMAGNDDHADAPPYLVKLLNAINRIPASITGKTQCKLHVEGVLDRPIIEANLAIADIHINRQLMPAIDAEISYDMAPRVLRIDRFIAQGGVDEDAVLKIDGDVTLPVKDAQGRDLVPGPINLNVEAQKINPAQLAYWFPGLGLNQYAGEMDITAFTINNATTSRPQFQASVEWYDPVIRGVPFDAINAIVSLEKDPKNPANQRLWIGQHRVADGFATVHFADSAKSQAKPVEVSGYLPVTWTGPLHPSIPANQVFSLVFRIPDQRIESIRSYLPLVSKEKTIIGDGSIAGQLTLGGTCAYPKFIDNSYLRVESPELALPLYRVKNGEQVTYLTTEAEHASAIRKAGKQPLDIKSVGSSNFPNRLRDIVLDMRFDSEEENGHPTNLVNLREFSAALPESSDQTDKKSLIEWVRNIFGKSKPDKEIPSSVTAMGTVKFPTPAAGWGPLAKLPQQLRTAANQTRYDVYAKALRTPIHWGDLFSSDVTAYVHLGNQPDSLRPLLTGVLYAEKTTVTYSASTPGTATLPTLPFNPDISLLLQFGQGNRFIVNPKVLYGSVYAAFPITPTGPALFTPNQVADQYLQQSRKNEKPPLTPHPVHMMTANSLRALGGDEYSHGSYGAIEGTLARPVVDITYVLQPNKSQVQLPGGLLAVRSAQGKFHYAFGSDTPAKLMVMNGEATGSLDQYGITAQIESDNLLAETERLPVRLQTSSTPPGMRDLGEDEIYARLFGMQDFLSLMQGKQNVLSPVILNKVGTNMLLGSWMRKFASTMNLETFSLSFDPNWAPEATMTTPEFLASKWGAFRLGAMRTFTDTPLWRTWIDYRIPNSSSWLQHLSLTGELNNERNLSDTDFNINLQYTLPFSTSRKSADSYRITK